MSPAFFIPSAKIRAAGCDDLLEAGIHIKEYLCLLSINLQIYFRKSHVFLYTILVSAIFLRDFCRYTNTYLDD